MPRRHPIVIAYHLVWTAYGTWLPNDPRGSGSHCVASPLLAELGEVHYGRRRVQPPRRVVSDFYERAEEMLDYPIIRFNGKQSAEIAAAFAATIERHTYTCYACAILSDHVHVVIRKHRDRAEAMIALLQHDSRLRLSDSGAIPARHPAWTRGGWKRFLDSPDAVRSVIRYVENNPTKAGLPRQSWGFVTPYDGWTLDRRQR